MPHHHLQQVLYSWQHPVLCDLENNRRLQLARHTISSTLWGHGLWALTILYCTPTTHSTRMMRNIARMVLKMIKNSKLSYLFRCKFVLLHIFSCYGLLKCIIMKRVKEIFFAHRCTC